MRVRNRRRQHDAAGEEDEESFGHARHTATSGERLDRDEAQPAVVGGPSAVAKERRAESFFNPSEEVVAFAVVQRVNEVRAELRDPVAHADFALQLGRTVEELRERDLEALLLEERRVFS